MPLLNRFLQDRDSPYLATRQGVAKVLLEGFFFTVELIGFSLQPIKGT